EAAAPSMRSGRSSRRCTDTRSTSAGSRGVVGVGAPKPRRAWLLRSIRFNGAPERTRWIVLEDRPVIRAIASWGRRGTWWFARRITVAASRSARARITSSDCQKESGTQGQPPLRGETRERPQLPQSTVFSFFGFGGARVPLGQERDPGQGEPGCEELGESRLRRVRGVRVWPSR